MPLQKNTIIIDANVILRYLLKDNEKFYKEAEALLAVVKRIVSGILKGLSIHLCKFYYSLSSNKITIWL